MRFFSPRIKLGWLSSGIGRSLARETAKERRPMTQSLCTWLEEKSLLGPNTSGYDDRDEVALLGRAVPVRWWCNMKQILVAGLPLLLSTVCFTQMAGSAPDQATPADRMTTHSKPRLILRFRIDCKLY